MKTVFGREFYTIIDLARELNKSVPTIYRWVKEGKLNGFRCGNSILFSSDFDAHLN
jgi:excisionase family DNA binding protein